MGVDTEINANPAQVEAEVGLSMAKMHFSTFYSELSDILTMTP